jgi:hypothetical protein
MVPSPSSPYIDALLGFIRFAKYLYNTKIEERFIAGTLLSRQQYSRASSGLCATVRSGQRLVESVCIDQRRKS